MDGGDQCCVVSGSGNRCCRHKIAEHASCQDVLCSRTGRDFLVDQIDVPVHQPYGSDMLHGLLHPRDVASEHYEEYTAVRQRW